MFDFSPLLKNVISALPSLSLLLSCQSYREVGKASTAGRLQSSVSFIRLLAGLTAKLSVCMTVNDFVLHTLWALPKITE